MRKIITPKDKDLLSFLSSINNGDRLFYRVEKYLLKKKGCWCWTGAIDKGGYPRIHYTTKTEGKNKNILAHRIYYMLVNDTWIKGKSLCHKCDNPSCINPEHLFLGSQQDNLKDMRDKGRDKGVGTLNREKTHCNNGHALSGANLRIEGKRKARRCIKCESIKKRKYYEERNRV